MEIFIYIESHSYRAEEIIVIIKFLHLPIITNSFMPSIKQTFTFSLTNFQENYLFLLTPSPPHLIYNDLYYYRDEMTNILIYKKNNTDRFEESEYKTCLEIR